MSLKRVFTLFSRELLRGATSFLFIFAIVVPLVVSLMVSLLFGGLLSGKPTLAIADAGSSTFVSLAEEIDSLILRQYDTPEALHTAVSAGAADMGIILPANFDAQLRQGTDAPVTLYVWGQSLLKDRAILGSAIVALLRDVSGQAAPVTVTTETLGGAETLPWEERLLPFIVMLTVLIGGIMVPATSLVDEKQKRTLTAINITPTSLADVFVAKGLVGILLSIVMGAAILVINRAFGAQPLLLSLLLLLGAIMAATFGIILGALIKDINTLFATIKAIGLLLYAPAIIYMFPDIPQWIGRLFPTYYMIAPVVEISQRGGGWNDIAVDVAILVALILLLMGVLAVLTRRLQLQLAAWA
ncbi:MAG: ABC transporter permease [Anaerolineales bacterium]|nr:ABC transporter permease [Anaerolineales bacterium]